MLLIMCIVPRALAAASGLERGGSPFVRSTIRLLTHPSPAHCQIEARMLHAPLALKYPTEDRVWGDLAVIGVGPLNIVDIPQKSVPHRIAGYEEVVVLGRGDTYLLRRTVFGIREDDRSTR